MMLLKIRHALLEVTNQGAKQSAKQSAVIINNEIIISSGSILQPFIRAAGEGEQILRDLQQCKLVDAQDETSKECQLLRSYNYLVTFDRQHRPLTEQQHSGQSAHILTRYAAQPLYVFSAEEVSRNLHRILINADADEQNVLRSSFVVLTIRALKERESFKRFLQHIASYLRYLQPIHTLDDVLVMCSPFGLENFYKTISIGKVANVMGASLFGLSNALPLGCEGAAVFNNRLRLIGIIICTSFQRVQENVNLTLAANFGYLLRDFMEQLGTPITMISSTREPSNFAWERSIAVIESGGQQGTGTFIKVHNRRFILTCGHVIGQPNAKLHCRAIDREFEAEVIWHNPDEDRPYDLALLTAPSDVPVRHCVRLARNRACLGQTVYNAGFPYYVNFNFKYDFNPSIFQGRIIKCDQGAIMSDGSVQAGQSGGPMFDQHGNILGVCVSNIKYEDVVYPNINTAIPIYDIRQTLVEFAKTSDINVLSNLLASQDVRRVWSLQLPPIQSKL
ncbi:CG3589 [Drosophila busckii]|uniref:Peroxisomal leader peptide-processing protease n=1 Tax=Drosophila busckii TaxID=30019 RepID=A0A0M4EH99_DROBS|nr:peroxisomal leader peptide-processing protease [Drosophila busckii]ALC41910.1 CG3589 [Drosophila busckii]